MAFQQALARITIDGEVTERIGTLEEIVQWVEDDDENIYRFCYWNKGYTWFTDVSPYEPDGVTEEDKETYPVTREYPGGGWYADKFLVHGTPLPYTAANVENYLKWTAKWRPGKKWEVELYVSTVKEASDRVYDVFLSKNGQDGVKVTTGTLKELVQQMENHNEVKFSSEVKGYDFDSGAQQVGYRWFTDWIVNDANMWRAFGFKDELEAKVYASANHTVPTVQIDYEDFNIDWFRVISMPYTVENVSNYIHYTTVKLNNSVQWAVELKEVL